MQSNFLTIFLLLAFTASCTFDEYGDSYNENDITVSESKDALSEVIGNSTISSDAPNGLGLLISKRRISYGKMGIGTCTMFHVGDDIALTNSHCIPDMVKWFPRKDCSEYLAGVFKTENGIQKRKCKKVLSYSKIDKDKTYNTDYAVVQLDSKIEENTSFTLSRAGFQNLEENIVHSFDPMTSAGTKKIFGKYKKSYCISPMNSMLGAFYDERSTTIPIFKSDDYSSLGCDIIHGNSGSPVTSMDGTTVRGIVYAGIFLENTERPEFKNVNTGGFATNIKCLDFDDDVEIEAVDSTCQNFILTEEKLSEDYKKGLVPDGFETLLKNEIVAMFDDLPSNFRYELEKEETNIQINLKCMLPFWQWTEDQKEDLIERRPYGNSIIKLMSTGVLPNLEIDTKLHLDKFAMPELTTSVQRGQGKPYRIYDIDRVTSDLERAGSTDNHTSLYLRLCTNEEISQSIYPKLEEAQEL